LGRKLTPERQKLKQEALSLRYDYGWTERRIVDQLGGKKSTIHDWLVGNSHTPLVDNNGNIQHLEGIAWKYCQGVDYNMTSIYPSALPYLTKTGMLNGKLFFRLYPKHLGSTRWTYALCRWPTVLHSYGPGIPHFPFGTALHAVCLHRSASFLD